MSALSPQIPTREQSTKVHRYPPKMPWYLCSFPCFAGVVLAEQHQRDLLGAAMRGKTFVYQINNEHTVILYVQSSCVRSILTDVLQLSRLGLPRAIDLHRYILRAFPVRAAAGKRKRSFTVNTSCSSPPVFRSPSAFTRLSNQAAFAKWYKAVPITKSREVRYNPALINSQHHGLLSTKMASRRYNRRNDPLRHPLLHVRLRRMEPTTTRIQRRP